MRHPLFAVLPLLALLAAPAAASGQTTQTTTQQLTCVVPAEPSKAGDACVQRVSREKRSGSVIVRVEDRYGRRLANQLVNFELVGNAGRIQTQARTDASGFAEAVWTGPLDSAQAHVNVTAMIGDTTVYRTIRFAAAQPPTNRVLAMSARVPHWYTERQLRSSTLVEILNYGEDCSANLIAFRPVGTGTASPDTVRADTAGWAEKAKRIDRDVQADRATQARRAGQPVPPDTSARISTARGRCFAESFWRLGNGVGRQHMRVSFADEPTKNRTLTAIARALPRIGGGVIGGYDFRDYEELKVSADTIQVTRKIPVSGPAGGDSTVVVDSIFESQSVKTVEGDAFTAPTINADFPVVAKWRWLRGSIAVSLQNPDRDWFTGVSLLQPVFGVVHENLGVDLHVAAHIGRRRVVKDATCDDDGDMGDCDDEERLLFMGMGFMATVDGTGILSTLTSIFK